MSFWMEEAEDTTDEGVAIDQDYHKSMLELRQKVSPREVVAGKPGAGVSRCLA